MAKPNWLICNLGKDEHINQLSYAAQEVGCKVDIISLSEAAEIYNSGTVDLSKDAVITCGSIWFNKMMKDAHPNWFGNFHSKDTFKCSTYYAYWGKHLVQRDYGFYPLGEIIRNVDKLYFGFGGSTEKFDRAIFVRPDSGEKEFVGEVVRQKDFEFWSQRTIREWQSPLDLMCVVAKPEFIEKELRLIIANKKVVAGSVYKEANHIWYSNLDEQDDKDEIIAYAEMVLNDNPPPLPLVHVLDLGYINNVGWKIMEVGCFCCCGMYNCDRRKVAAGVSEAVERAYEIQRQSESQVPDQTPNP